MSYLESIVILGIFFQHNNIVITFCSQKSVILMAPCTLGLYVVMNCLLIISLLFKLIQYM